MATRARSNQTSSGGAAADRAALRRRARRIVAALKRAYPDAQCALRFDSPFQLLVATILSAQCTDERVNQVAAELFAKYPTAEKLDRVPLSRLETLIKSTGFFRNKAKNIKACCRELVKRYGGQVPADLDALVALPGVGRKTANVVLGTAFGEATGIVVDTHVGRIVRRLGLTTQRDPNKVEQDLMELIPRSEWIDFSHRLIHHGRQVCKARKPRCDECVLEAWCPREGVAS